jgi:hypothetical protein
MRTTKPTKLVSLGRTTAVKTFTRNNNNAIQARNGRQATTQPVTTQPSCVAGFKQARFSFKQSLVLAFTLVLASFAFGASSASSASAAGSVTWSVQAVAEPSVFSAKDSLACEAEEKCDRYQLLVQNVSHEASQGTVTLTDVLPAGITTVHTPESGYSLGTQLEWECPKGGGRSSVTCEFEEPVPPGGYAPYLGVIVTAPKGGKPGVLSNEVTVESEGAATVTSTLETPANGPASSFGVNEFAFQAAEESGAPSVTAGGHPWDLTTGLGVPAVAGPAGSADASGEQVEPVSNIKTVVVELPLGFFGDTRAATKPEDLCTEAQLRVGACPAESQVGTLAFTAGLFGKGQFSFTGDGNGCCSAVYNMKPEAGYPAEFGLTFATIPVELYASAVHTPAGYRLRVVIPGVPQEIGLIDSQLTFYGEPGQENGTGSEATFLTNPVACNASPSARSARVELTAWSEPNHPVSRESTAYPSITGCNLLQLGTVSEPASLSVAPSPPGPGPQEEGSTQTDTPSAYSVNLKIPQTTAFSEPASSELRNATVTLPAGVSVSPSAATGLVGCQETGPEGINIGSSNIGPAGQDLGDPEATEFGGNYEGGNHSQYDDGVWHTAPGHCLPASKVGSVEVCTPVLPNRANSEGHKEEGVKACEEHTGIAPLQGNVYLAQPKCGGSGQPECTPASATNGELYALYIEAEGSGVIIKLAGKVAANPATGQLTSTFTENPQLPFNELRLHLNGGPRAPLANPQTCGTFTTTSLLEPWSHEGPDGTEGTPNATPSSSFAIGGCAGNPFNPSFSAGTTSSAAGAYSPFTLTFSRNDGEQDLAGLNVTLPPGLLGKLAGVEQCPEVQANAGTCGPNSQIGSVSVLAGPGTQPYYVTGGQVYLTGPYNGGPFGLSIVVPAKAGPFNLGNEVVRAAIHIDPQTGQVSVSNAIPQIRDGVPFRLRTANVEINRPNFTFNATNCSPSSVSGSIGGSGGASAAVSSPYQATGCGSLPFAPQFSASTQGQASKANGASLTVKVGYPQGNYANIHKVDVSLPKALPSRLTTLQKACTEAQFASNPAGCPSASAVGMATATTPLLNSPLTGPAYLVSRGGAAFPDLVLLLQGEGVEIELVGNTDIKNGITYSRFETVPDAPVSSFELTLPQGPYSILGTNLPAGANYSLCGQNLVMPTEITGQNGATIKQNTKIAVTGACAAISKPTVKIKQAKVKGNTVLVTVTTSQEGAVTVTGKGLKPVKKSLTAGTHQLKLVLTKTGKTARKHHSKTKLQATVKSSGGSTTTTKTLKL